MRALEIVDGVAVAEWSGEGAPPVGKGGRLVVDVTNRPSAKIGDSYNAQTDIFTAPPPKVPTTITKADVIALLTPSEWAEMNRYHPTALTAPYNDADVFWAVSIFNQATSVDLADQRATTVLGVLVTKQVLSQARGNELLAQMQALAAGRS